MENVAIAALFLNKCIQSLSAIAKESLESFAGKISMFCLSVNGN